MAMSGRNNEQGRLLRQYLPKGTDLAHFSQQELDDIAWKFNTRPRKSLNWKCPAELFLPDNARCRPWKVEDRGLYSEIVCDLRNQPAGMCSKSLCRRRVIVGGIRFRVQRNRADRRTVEAITPVAFASGFWPRMAEIYHEVATRC